MIGAEWKKLLRQRWLIGIAILLIFVDVGLFLNTQYTEKKDRVAAVPLFAEYQKETADMTNEQAQEYLTDQLNTLSNFQFVQIALNGEVDEGLLQGLVEENPNILEEYQQAGYEEDPLALMTKIQVISELLGQYQNVSGYQAYLESIQTQYEQMKDSSFYEGRPYAEAQGKKTTEDFAKLQGTEPEIGMNWGVEALMEEQISSEILILLALGICIVLVSQDRTHDLFGLLRSCRRGHGCLIAAKFAIALTAVLFLGISVYGSQIAIAWKLYGMGNLNRPMQSVNELNESARQLTVGGYLLDYYLRHLIAVLVLTAFMLCLFLSIYSTMTALVVVGICAVLCAVGYWKVPEIAVNSWIHFLNPVAWFWSSQLYEGYWNINLFGKPVNALTANTCFQLVLAIGCVADSILLGKRIPGKRKVASGRLQRWIESAKERLWYPSSVIGQEWRKQLLKNGIVWMMMTAAIILLYSTRTTPVTVGQTEKIYNEYAKKHEGIADQTLIEALQQEKEQFDKLRQRQVELTEKWRKEEVSDEQYASINALIDRMLQNEAGLMRAIEQANTLVSWSKAHDYQLFFTDDSIGRYLFENANMDQYRGAVLLFIVIVLLSGIFPGERKNEMQNMLLCTKNGRRPLFVAKYVLGVVIACIVSGGFTVIHLFSASKMYDFSLWEVPLQSIRQAQVIDVQLSVRGYLVWTSVMQMMGVVCAAISFLSISVWMKNRLYAVLAGAVLFVLPVIASGAGMSNIFGLWFAKLFLFGTQTLKQGFGVQIGYLILLVAVASVFTAAAWRAYQRKRRAR